jgi:hypothetical protein
MNPPIPPQILKKFEEQRLAEEKRIETFGNVREPIHIPTDSGMRIVAVPTPPTWRTHCDTRSPEICSNGFAANMRCSFDAPQRPSQSSQRDDLLFLFFAQDIAHVTERNFSASSMSRFSYLIGRFSGVHVWPVLGVPRGHFPEFSVTGLIRMPSILRWIFELITCSSHSFVISV